MSGFLIGLAFALYVGGLYFAIGRDRGENPGAYAWLALTIGLLSMTAVELVGYLVFLLRAVSAPLL